MELLGVHIGDFSQQLKRGEKLWKSIFSALYSYYDLSLLMLIVDVGNSALYL